MEVIRQTAIIFGISLIITMLILVWVISLVFPGVNRTEDKLSKLLFKAELKHE